MNRSKVPVKTVKLTVRVKELKPQKRVYVIICRIINVKIWIQHFFI